MFVRIYIHIGLTLSILLFNDKIGYLNREEATMVLIVKLNTLDEVYHDSEDGGIFLFESTLLV